ncbi:HD domain-containing protein [Patescibacteria group bacterium]|nr:HD domain-containing protein [Patescibacteria group bacterium]
MVNNLVDLAEEYCKHFHKSQKRKGGNQEPYISHPFAVRDIMVKYGCGNPENQAIALLHDTIEDTVLGEHKSEIEKRFGMAVYHGVYVLSRNTPGKHAQKLDPLFRMYGVEYIDEHGLLTPKAYKLRLLFSKESIKRIKIADMIHNTTALPDLSDDGIRRKIKDAETFYIPIGKAIAPVMVKELEQNIENYKNSKHYERLIG